MSPIQLKKLRKRLGRSQVELARRMKISPNTVWRWEKGQRKMHPIFADYLRQIAKEAEKAA